MANYTMTLKTVMESLTGKVKPVTYNELPQLFDNVRSILFPNFPIFDEGHRIPLENLIMGKFLTREICVTPYANWQFKFNQKLMEIMPYYNQLYESLGSKPINPFDDTNYTRTTTTKRDLTMSKGTTDTSTSTSSSTASGTFNPGTQRIDTHISTPQSEIQSFLDNKYISDADKSVTSGEDNSLSTNDSQISGEIKRSGSDTDNENIEVSENIVGKRSTVSYLELLGKYKDIVFSVDQMILDELEELFFMVY